jgi:hypothetical protein
MFRGLINDAISAAEAVVRHQHAWAESRHQV